MDKRDDANAPNNRWPNRPWRRSDALRTVVADSPAQYTTTTYTWPDTLTLVALNVLGQKLRFPNSASEAGIVIFVVKKQSMRTLRIINKEISFNTGVELNNRAMKATTMMTPAALMMLAVAASAMEIASDALKPRSNSSTTLSVKKMS